MASANEFLKARGVHQLPPEHPDRRLALREWGRWFINRPNSDAKPAVKGWT